MSIIARANCNPFAPASQLMNGSAVQVLVADPVVGGTMLLSIPGTGVVHGRQFYVVAQGFYISKVTNQQPTFKVRARAGTTGSFADMGTLQAGAVFTNPSNNSWFVELNLYADNALQAVDGFQTAKVIGLAGAGSASKAPAACANPIPSVQIGQYNSTAASVNSVLYDATTNVVTAMQFDIEVLSAAVADTTSSVVVTNFYAGID